MTTTHPSVYIVLLHWKDYNDTKQCLLSVRPAGRTYSEGMGVAHAE